MVDSDEGLAVLELMVLVVVVSAALVAADASRVGAGRGGGGGFLDMSPAGWFLSVLLVWIVALPAYLVVRPRLLEVAGALAPDGPPHPREAWITRVPPPAPLPKDVTTGGSLVDSLERLGRLRAGGVLTEPELEEAKRQVLGGAPQRARQGIAAASRRPPAGSGTVTGPGEPPHAAR